MIAPFAFLIRRHAIERFDQFVNAHRQTCFLFQLTSYSFAQRFSQLQHASGNGPFAFQRRPAPPN
jgi:hypothetical protein